MYKFCDSKNRPQDIAIEAQDELDEDEKGPTILKSEIVKAIKTCEERRPQETTTYQWIYSRNWEREPISSFRRDL